MNNKEACNTQEEDQKRQENTSCYLKKYLDPVGTWDKTITPEQRIEYIKNADVHWSVIAYHIQSMEYQNFLKTPYWRAIAAHTKYKAGYRCQICNSSQKLATHHRNYAIRGYEHSQMQELTVLCDNCHNQFHRKSHGSFQYKFTGRPYGQSHNQLPNNHQAHKLPSYLSLYTMATVTILSVIWLFYSQESEKTSKESYKRTIFIKNQDLKKDVPENKDISDNNVHKKINPRNDRFSR